jgi:hypothetical protein
MSGARSRRKGAGGDRVCWRWHRPDGTKSEWHDGLGPPACEREDALLNGYGWGVSFVGSVEAEGEDE